MDKNQIIGFLLIGVILVGFVFLSKPSKEEQERQKQYQDSIALVEQQRQQDMLDSVNNIVNDSSVIDQQIVVNDSTIDSLKAVELKNNYGVFANSATGEEKFYTVQNDLVKITIKNKGANVYSAQLLNFTSHDGSPLLLFEGEGNNFNINFFAQDKVIQTDQLYFETDLTDTVITITDKPQSVSFKAKVSETQYLEYVYTLEPNSYVIDFNINFVNLEKIIPVNTTFLEMFWNENLRHLERGEKWERQNTMMYYKLAGESVEKLNNKKDFVEEEVSRKISWISYKQQFFNASLIAENGFDYSNLKSQTLPEDSTDMFFMSSKLTVPFQVTDNANVKLKYFFGPNQYNVLKKVTVNDEKMKMEQLVPLGGKLLSYINKGVIIPLFNFLGRFIKNYGIIILVMTLIIKLVLFPLTYKSYASSAKMKILKPEIDKVLEKIPQDKQMERQQATMDLYKKAGVNPMGGCLPTLLQFPILVALYRFFPASIELRQKTFLWVQDLSTYDAILTWNANIPVVNWIFGNHVSLFTLLMAVAMIFNTMLTNANSTMDSSNPQAKTMKYMMYLMPLMMIVWFNGYSAGLSYYYFLSSVIGILQVLLVRKLIDEDKVLAKLKENMKNNKGPKKSKFQQRLEEMQKQQAQQTQQTKYRKK